MKGAVVYYSKSGNTKKVADAIAYSLGLKAQSIEEKPVLEGLEILFLGGAVYAWDIDPVFRNFIQTLTPEMVKTVAVFSTAAGQKNVILGKVKDALKDSGVTVDDNEFHCKGKFLFFNRKRPNEQDLAAAQGFAKAVCAAHGCDDALSVITYSQ